MYSTIVTGAEALPSTLPRWGMPLKSAVLAAASGRALTVVGFADDDPPLKATARPIATASPARPATAKSSTFVEACRPPVLRTGGLATWPVAAAVLVCRSSCL